MRCSLIFSAFYISTCAFFFWPRYTFGLIYVCLVPVVSLRWLWLVDMSNVDWVKSLLTQIFWHEWTKMPFNEINLREDDQNAFVFFIPHKNPCSSSTLSKHKHQSSYVHCPSLTIFSSNWTWNSQTPFQLKIQNSKTRVKAKTTIKHLNLQLIEGILVILLMFEISMTFLSVHTIYCWLINSLNQSALSSQQISDMSVINGLMDQNSCN